MTTDSDCLERDIDVTCAVREAFPDSAILVDANDGYSLRRRSDMYPIWLQAVAISPL